MRRIMRTIMLALAVSALAGCYGQFALTKKVHKWNGSVTDNKFVHTLLFWGMVIIPVYQVVTFVDGVFFNVVEFWTGANLLENPGALSASAMADGSVVYATADHRYRIYPQGQDAVRIFVDGVYAGRAFRTADGAVAIENVAAGQTMVVSANDVAELERLAAR